MRLSTVIRWASVAIWMAAIWYLSNQPSLSTGLEYDWWLRKAAHMGEYMILFWLLVRAMQKERATEKFFVAAFIITVLYAMSDEWHQTFITGRHGSLRDVSIDSIGAAIGWLIMQWRDQLMLGNKN